MSDGTASELIRRHYTGRPVKPEFLVGITQCLKTSGEGAVIDYLRRLRVDHPPPDVDDPLPAETGGEINDALPADSKASVPEDPDVACSENCEGDPEEVEPNGEVDPGEDETVEEDVEEYFALIPKGIVKDPEIRPFDLRVYGAIALYTRGRSRTWCDLSVGTIAETVGRGANRVRQAIRRLEGRAWVTSGINPGRKSRFTVKIRGDREPVLKVRRAVVVDRALSDGGFRLGCELLGFGDRRTGLCCPRESELAKNLGVKAREVRRRITELVVRGYIGRSRDGRGNRYELTRLYGGTT